MRITDLFLIIPGIAILAIALQLWGHTDLVIILVLAGLFWMYVARIVRGEVLSLKEKEFVEAAARRGGVTDPDHRAPHHPEHRRLDHGEHDPAVSRARSSPSRRCRSWASGCSRHRRRGVACSRTPRATSGRDKSYLIYAPGLMILITVLAVNFIGDGLRDAFDPQSEKH